MPGSVNNEMNNYIRGNFLGRNILIPFFLWNMLGGWLKMELLVYLLLMYS